MANEKRLIDANAIPWEEHYVPDGDTQWEYKKELCVLKPTIDAMTTVDAVEVVHGHWTTLYKVDTWMGTSEIDCFVCSECGKSSKAKGNYCPHCGAKMDEVIGDE